MRLVLVSCCAPCSAGAIKQLHDGDVPGVDDFIVMFFNPNIFPASEYQKRMAEQIRYCDAMGVRHVELEYDHDAWRRAVRGMESEPERGARCSACFEFRFARAAQWARENGYDAIASVLGVSRHKDQAQVDRAAIAAIGRTTMDGATPSQTAPASPRPGGGNYRGAENFETQRCVPAGGNYPVAGGNYSVAKDGDHYAAIGGKYPATGADCGLIPPAQAGGGAMESHRGVAKTHTRQYTTFALKQSKTLKRNMTDAERLLWYYLRGRRDFSFRKQAPIGNYIVDFVCIAKKLIIELDGAQHGDAPHRVHDAARDAFLHQSGYTILRFWNDEVFNKMDMVLDVIYSGLTRQMDATCGVATPSQTASASPRPGGGNYRGAGADCGLIPPAWAGGGAMESHRGVADKPIQYMPIKWDEALRQQIGRASEFYRQNYCGCEFSIRTVKTLNPDTIQTK